MVLAAVLCVAADVGADPIEAPVASGVSASPGKKKPAEAHAFLRGLVDSQELGAKDKAGIEALIADLGHDDWQTREKATVELSRRGPEALPLLRVAAKSKDPEVVARAGRIVEAIEAAAGDPSAELIAAIDVLAAGRDKRVVGLLIELLGHPGVWARYAAEYGLRRITGKAFGYSAYEDAARRAAAAAKWRTWWKESKAKFSFESAASQAKQFGLLVCDDRRKILAAVTPAGKVAWTRKVGQRIYGVGGEPNGNVLVAYGSGNRTIEEFDRDFKSVWNSDGVRDVTGQGHDVSRLANGNTLIVCAQGVSEVTRAGEIAWQKKGLQHPISARRLVNGNTLICEHKQMRVIEVNRAGDIVWQKTGLKNPCDAEKLVNGNVLIGTDNSKRVVEVNRAGKIVWERHCSNGAYAVCRLPDGETGIFIFGEGAILVDRGGKKTRDLFKSPAGWGRIHMVPPAVLKQR